MEVTDALLGALVALAAAWALTPLTARLAVRVGAIDEPRERGLSTRPTPLLGGLAILIATLVAGLIWLPDRAAFHGILAAAVAITVVGVLDDLYSLPAPVKLAGQAAATLPAILSGVTVDDFTFPFLGRVDLGGAGQPVTAAGMVLVMNVVNLSDGVDGLAAGVCAITAGAFAVIAFDLERNGAGVLAAITAGAALGFLAHNFHPASIFMGDSGSNLLGMLLACVAVEGTVKTQAVIALIIPLVLLAVPFLDTTFVVLKRLKYRRSIYGADAEHFHHRLARIGYSQRRTLVFFYGWTLLLAGLALAMRFIPYSDGHGNLHAGWSALLAGCGLVVAAASLYLVYELEIVKFRRLDALRLRRLRPQATDEEIDEEVERHLETAEFERVRVDPETGEFEAVRP